MSDKKKRNQQNIVYIRPVEPVQDKDNKRGADTSVKSRFIILILASVAVLVSLYYAYMNVGVFTQVALVKSYDQQAAANNVYASYGDDVLRYGKDGMAVVDGTGEERWNAPYQINNPFIERCGEIVVVADRNGNQIIILDSEQVKGSINTTLPIDRLSVSEQGIVAVLVNDSGSSQVLCYDVAGNLLLEHHASETAIGYPLDIAISSEGTYLFITYLQYNEGAIQTNYRCYNLKDADQVASDKLMIQGVVKDTISPTVFFMNQTKVVLVMDKTVKVYDVSKGEQIRDITFEEEIQQVLQSEKHFGLVLKNINDRGDNIFRTYNNDGSLVSEIIYQGEYSNISYEGNQIIMYEGNLCKIYSINGKEIFDGELEMDIVSLVPIKGLNKYLVIGKNSWINIRLSR